MHNSITAPPYILWYCVCSEWGSSAPALWMLVLCKGMGGAGDGPSCLVHVHAITVPVSLCLCTRVHGERKAGREVTKCGMC